MKRTVQIFATFTVLLGLIACGDVPSGGFDAGSAVAQSSLVDACANGAPVRAFRYTNGLVNVTTSNATWQNGDMGEILFAAHPGQMRVASTGPTTSEWQRNDDSGGGFADCSGNLTPVLWHGVGAPVPSGVGGCQTYLTSRSVTCVWDTGQVTHPVNDSLKLYSAASPNRWVETGAVLSPGGWNVNLFGAIH